MNKWEVVIEEDVDGDVILPFPPELIKKYGWQEGDELDFIIEDGAAIVVNLTAKERELGKLAQMINTLYNTNL